MKSWSAHKLRTHDGFGFSASGIGNVGRSTSINLKSRREMTMAKQAKAKDGERRERGSKRSPRKERTGQAQIRHTRNQERQEARAKRPDSAVSANCLKKREKRDRARVVKSNGISPSTFGTEAGEKQFGDKAKGYHLQQRAYGLKHALTPAYVAQLKSAGHIFSNATLIGAGLRPDPEIKIKQAKQDRQ